jgi:hypothetical protein
MDNDNYYYYANATDFTIAAGAAKKRWEDLMRGIFGSRKRITLCRDRAGDGYMYGFKITREALKELERKLVKHKQRKTWFFMVVDGAVKAKDTLILNPLHEAFLINFLAQLEKVER